MIPATPSDAPIPHEDRAHTPPATLSWPSFAIALAILVGIFMFTNPIWEDHDMNAWNQNIYWSYIPIPLIVGALLFVERKFSWPALGLEVMKMTFVKFFVTYSMASMIWDFRGAPGTGIAEATFSTDSQTPAFEVRPIPTVFTTWPESELSTLAGVVRDADGSPLAERIVFVQSGLEGSSFAPPREPAVFTNEGSGFAPALQVLQAHQVLSLNSGPGDLHTAVFDDNRSRRILNVAVVPGTRRELMFDAAFGHLELSCSVHGDAEASAHVLVLDHPFWARTDANGEFRMEGIPPGVLQFAVHDPAGSKSLDSIEFSAGDDHQVEWNLSSE